MSFGVIYPTALFKRTLFVMRYVNLILMPG
jgi:hypothetical protein